MSQDLIKRLEATTEGSGKLDREICEALGLLSSNTCEFNHWPLRVTSSIDSAVALAERVLPNHTGGFQPGIEGMTWATVYYVSPVEVYEVAKSKAATPALALCIAILKAKEAQDATHTITKGQHMNCLNCKHRYSGIAIGKILYVPSCKLLKRSLPYDTIERGGKVYAVPKNEAPDECPLKGE